MALINTVLLPLSTTAGSDNLLANGTHLTLNTPVSGNFVETTQFFNAYYFDWPVFGKAIIRLTDVPPDTTFNIFVYDNFKILHVKEDELRSECDGGVWIWRCGRGCRGSDDGGRRLGTVAVAPHISRRRPRPSYRRRGMTQATTRSSNDNRAWLNRLWPLVPIVAALIFTSGLLLLFDAGPIESFQAMWAGAFGGQDKILSVLAFWVPLLLCSAGLVITFTAGLWNIGVEGQIVLGAIFASWVALHVTAPAWVLVPLEIGAAMLGGALWAGLAGLLKTRGKVNEIFSGLALNNLAIILTNYLISGPWQPPEGGSFRGTTPFQSAALLPRLWDSRFSPLSLILAIVAVFAVYYVLRGTTWGLKLKALGKNPYATKSALVMPFLSVLG